MGEGGLWGGSPVGGGAGGEYAYAGRRDALGASARFVNQSVRTDYSIQNAVVRLCYHRSRDRNNGVWLKYQSSRNTA